MPSCEITFGTFKDTRLVVDPHDIVPVNPDQALKDVLTSDQNDSIGWVGITYLFLDSLQQDGTEVIRCGIDGEIGELSTRRVEIGQPIQADMPYVRGVAIETYRSKGFAVLIPPEGDLALRVVDLGQTGLPVSIIQIRALPRTT